MSSLLVCLLAGVVLANGPQDPMAPKRTPERFIVILADRSFDLDKYRDAVRSRGAIDSKQTLSELDAAVRTDQAALVDVVTRELGGRVLAQWWLVNGFSVELDPAQVATLKAHPRVAKVYPDQVRRLGRFIKTSTDANNHGADAVQAQGVKGKGSVLAVVDSGVDSKMGSTNRPHATFYVNGDVNNSTGGGIAGSRLLVNKQIGLMSADDLIAHGTAVAGVAAGAKWNQGATADDGHAPLAQIVSYSVADDAVGGTYATTLTSAWQAVAADRLTYGTNVAVCSYEGYFDTGFPDQMAIEALANNGDVLVCGMGGNTADQAVFAYGATNMIAVGAVYANTRGVAPFSTRGPLLGDTARFYPDVVANGTDMRLPKADDEVNDKVGSGTSYSAPQVAGAALLYRSLRPLASATEVKAAILATSEDIAGKNLIAPYNSRNAYGLGYLRDDRLVGLATGKGMLQNSTVSSATPTRTFKFSVQAGQRYAAAIAWFRKDPSLFTWANLDLTIRSGTQVLASSTTTRNLYELVRFKADVTGLVDIEISAKSFEPSLTSQAFALAATESLPYWVQPQINTFGQSCPTPGFAQILPAGGEPRIATIYQIQLSTNVTLAPMLWLVGASNTRWLQFTLPLDLASLGAPNCILYVSPDITIASTTNGVGSNVLRITVPNDPALVDAGVFHQAVIGSPIANGLGAGFSNGVAGRIGGV